MHVHIACRNAHAPGLTLRYEVLDSTKKNIGGFLSGPF